MECANRGDSLLDLVLVSPMLCASSVINIPLLANSDHNGQLFSIATQFAYSSEKPRAALDYIRLDVICASIMFRTVNWSSEFNLLQRLDALVTKFQFLCFCIPHSCTPFIKRKRKHRKPLPKSTLR